MEKRGEEKWTSGLDKCGKNRVGWKTGAMDEVGGTLKLGLREADKVDWRHEEGRLGGHRSPAITRYPLGRQVR